MTSETRKTSGPAVRSSNEWMKLRLYTQEIGIASIERKSSSITEKWAMNSCQAAPYVRSSRGMVR